jgi:hypothetical protein
MKILHFISSSLLNLHFLLFANGFFCAAYIFFRIQDDYEHRILESVSKNILENEPNATEDCLIKKTIETNYYLLHRRSVIFKNGEIGGFLNNYIHPLSADLMTAEGACGSYSSILCGVLEELGFKTRFAQMKVNGKYGGHIIAEVKSSHGWVVMDPIYNLSFTRPDGQLASFNEVQSNWAWYKKQVPKDYNTEYNYEGVRHTNWEKIPVVMPMIRKTLAIFLDDEDLNAISLRTYFMRKYRVGANILLFFICSFSILIIKIAIKKINTMPILNALTI